VEWIHLAQDRGCCECGDEPSGSVATELVNIFHELLGVFLVTSSCYHHFLSHKLHNKSLIVIGHLKIVERKRDMLAG
jgi:hypothetical protein